MAEGGEAVASEAAPTAEADALIVDAGTKPMADQNAPVDQSGSGAAAPDAAGDGSYDAEGPVGAAAAAEAEEIRGEQNGVAAMAVDGLAAVQEAAPAGAFAAADQPGACETPLPEEEQAQVVAALSASATAGQQDALAAMSPHAPAVPASDGQAHEAGSTDEAEPQAGKPSAPPVAAAPPARVPARALYGLSVDEGENGQPAQQAQHVGGQSQRAQLPLLPRMEDDGRLPAYAVAGGEDSWQHDPGLRGARKGAHADEDPPPGFQPVDIFIGGLPPTADDFDVWQAVVPAGEVVGVKLIRRKRDRGDCRGYGFVRMANREAAEAACQTVKEACGVPVAMSLSSSKTLPELHAAAAAAAATTPLQLPKDSDSSLVQLMEAVRQQKDRQAAVTTALVAVLHVPQRPRLAFPAGRPKPAAEKPAAAVGGKQQRGAEGGPGTSSPAVGEEGLPDGTNYMDPYPAVKALMAEFKARGQDNKTPLAMLNEYASRLALRVDTEEQPPPEGATGPISVAIKLVNSRGGQSFATSTGRGRTKQIGRQIASAALLETILETVPAEDLLAPNRNKPGGGKQPWQAPQRHGVGHDVGGRGRGRGGGGGRHGPEGGRGGWGRSGGRYGGNLPPQFERKVDEGPSWGYSRGGGGGSVSMQRQPQQQGGNAYGTAVQFGGAMMGAAGLGGGLGGSQTAGFAGNAMQQQQQQQQQQLLLQQQLQQQQPMPQYGMQAAGALPVMAAGLAPISSGLMTSQAGAGYNGNPVGSATLSAGVAGSVPGAGYGGGYGGAALGSGYGGAAAGPTSTTAAYPGPSSAALAATAAGYGSSRANTFATPQDPRLRQGGQVQQYVGSGTAAGVGVAAQQRAAAAAATGSGQPVGGAMVSSYGQQQQQPAAAYGSYPGQAQGQAQQQVQQQQLQASPYKQSHLSQPYPASQLPSPQYTSPPQPSAAAAGSAGASAAERKYISNTAQQQQQQAAAAAANPPLAGGGMTESGGGYMAAWGAAPSEYNTAGAYASYDPANPTAAATAAYPTSGYGSYAAAPPYAAAATGGYGQQQQAPVASTASGAPGAPGATAASTAYFAPGYYPPYSGTGQ